MKFVANRAERKPIADVEGDSARRDFVVFEGPRDRVRHNFRATGDCFVNHKIF